MVRPVDSLGFAGEFSSVCGPTVRSMKLLTCEISLSPVIGVPVRSVRSGVGGTGVYFTSVSISGPGI